MPSPGSELDRKAPPRVRKPLPRNDQWKAPTPDLEGHRERLREALGNTLSDEFVDVILQSCQMYGPYATIRRANEIAQEASGLGYSFQVFHNGDGYYVRVC